MYIRQGMGTKPRRGSYALLVRLAQGRAVRVGRLGLVDFQPGYYLYLGSALGGLEGRIRRHLRGDKRQHWHIDALTTAGSPAGLWWAEGPERRECRWAEATRRLEGAETPVPGFGSSDCRCRSHLVFFASDPSEVLNLAGALSPASWRQHQDRQE